MPIWSSEIKELEAIYTSIKGRIPELEKELEQLIETKDANVVMLYSRRALEVIISNLCESQLKRPRKTEPLKGIIDKLHREEKVPPHIISSMDSLNNLSTFGAHPKDFDPEQVKPVLNNLAIIIRWYLRYRTEQEESVKTKKISEFQDSKQADIKEQVNIHKTNKNPYILISAILIIVVILILLFDPVNFFRKDKFEEIRDSEGKISIAVMPFENLTGDSTLNFFQRGMASLIINGLGNSPELAVMDDQTMFEVIESMNQVYTAGISPSIAREIAEKIKAEVYISGSIHGREETHWVLVNLVNTENGEILWTNKMTGNLKSSDYVQLVYSFCIEIMNYLEIKALESTADFDFREVFPDSAEAYRYFIEGVNSILSLQYDAGIKSLEKALEIDSNFTFASFYIAYAFCYRSDWEQATVWTKKAYNNKERIPPKYQLWLELWYACYVNKNFQDIYRYCNLIEESGINSRLVWFDLGVTYRSWYCDNPPLIDKAVSAFEKVMEISLERGGYWEYELYYAEYGRALHQAGNHVRENEIYDIGLNLFPDGWHILWPKAVCALSNADTINANKYLSKIRSIATGLGYSKSLIENVIGLIYGEANIADQAEVFFRKAYELEPQKIGRILWLAGCLINNDINVEEGMQLVQKGLEIEPDNAVLFWIQGRGYYKQGKYEESVLLLRKVMGEEGFINPDLCKHLREAEQALANQSK